MNVAAIRQKIQAKINPSLISQTDGQLFDETEYEHRREQRLKSELVNEIQRKRLERAQRLIEQSGLKSTIEKYTFTNFLETEEWQSHVKAIALDFAKNTDGGWLIAHGQTGSGKTHLCTAVAGELLRNQIPVMYMLWRQDSLTLKPSGFIDSKELQRRMQPYKTVQCLYIDDLFKGGASEADIRLAFELIDHRYRNECITIISTELLPNELIAIDEAVAGRIFEKSKKHRIVIGRDSAKNQRF